MHHHKSLFSRKKTRHGHGKKEHRQCSHESGHHRGYSGTEGRRIHHMGDFRKSGHGHHKKRKGTLHSFRSDTAPMMDQIGEKKFTYDTGLKLSVDLERCVRCGKCERVCPMGAIMVDEEIVQVDSSLCNGCGRCVDGCRERAISFRKNQEAFMI